MIYVKIGEIMMEAVVNGYRRDPKWDYRDVEEVTIAATADEVKALFHDGVDWELVQTFESYEDENGETVTPEPKTKNHGEFCVSGAVIDHRNGTVTIRMGKITDAEALAELKEALNV